MAVCNNEHYQYYQICIALIIIITQNTLVIILYNIENYI